MYVSTLFCLVKSTGYRPVSDSLTGITILNIASNTSHNKSFWIAKYIPSYPLCHWWAAEECYVNITYVTMSIVFFEFSSEKVCCFIRISMRSIDLNYLKRFGNSYFVKGFVAVLHCCGVIQPHFNLGNARSETRKQFSCRVFGIEKVLFCIEYRLNFDFAKVNLRPSQEFIFCFSFRVNKKLMRLSVDGRVNAKRSSILFDESSPIPSEVSTNHCNIQRFVYHSLKLRFECALWPYLHSAK